MRNCHRDLPFPSSQRNPPIKVKAIADVNEEIASQIVEKFRLKDAFICNDYRHLLKDSDMDAVWILTPPKLHAQRVVDAINCGKHVLCEQL